jgi:hypothetical protein
MPSSTVRLCLLISFVAIYGICTITQFNFVLNIAQAQTDPNDQEANAVYENIDMVFTIIFTFGTCVERTYERVIYIWVRVYERGCLHMGR